MSPAAGHCWLARHSDKACDGPMDRAHLIAKQTLKREVSDDPEFVWHPAVWRWACRLHHGDFDNGALRIQRTDLPESVEVFARKFDLTPKLDRRYGR